MESRLCRQSPAPWLQARAELARSLRWDREKADSLVPVVIKGRACAAPPDGGRRILQLFLACTGFPNSRLAFQGFRSFLNTAGSQLLISRDNRERLGNWSRMFTMPDEYDRLSGSVELHLRKQLFFRDGGQLDKNFELPRYGTGTRNRPRGVTVKESFCGSSFSESSSDSDSDSSSFPSSS